MNVSDVVDELLAQHADPLADFDMHDGALQVLCAAFQRCCPEYYGGGDPCARQMSGEAVALVRAALVAALAAIDAARVRCPSGPMGVVASQSSPARHVGASNPNHRGPLPQSTQLNPRTEQ